MSASDSPSDRARPVVTTPQRDRGEPGGRGGLDALAEARVGNRSAAQDEVVRTERHVAPPKFSRLFDGRRLDGRSESRVGAVGPQGPARPRGDRWRRCASTASTGRDGSASTPSWQAQIDGRGARRLHALRHRRLLRRTTGRSGSDGRRGRRTARATRDALLRDRGADGRRRTPRTHSCRRRRSRSSPRCCIPSGSSPTSWSHPTTTSWRRSCAAPTSSARRARASRSSTCRGRRSPARVPRSTSPRVPGTTGSRCCSTCGTTSGDPTTWADLEAVPLEEIAYLQFDDAFPWSRRRARRDARPPACSPAKASSTSTAGASEVRAKGFDGVVSVEVLNDELRDLDPAEFARARVRR